jgi:hypothetical protein
MDIGKLFKDGWGLLVKDVGPLIVGVLEAVIIPAVVAIVVVLATLGASFGSVSVTSQGDFSGFHAVQWTVFGIGMGLVVVAEVFLTAPLYAGVLMGVLRRVREGREMTYGDAFAGFSVFGRIVGATVLVYGLIPLALIVVPVVVIIVGAVASAWALVALGVLLLIAAIVVGVYLLVSWAYMFPVILDRGVGVIDALRESRTLVHGSGWWWTFLVLFLLELITGAVSAVLGVVPLIGSVVASVGTGMFALTYLAAMYFQARKEDRLIDEVLGVKPPGGVPAATYGGTAGPYPPPPPAPPPPPPAPTTDTAPPAVGTSPPAVGTSPPVAPPGIEPAPAGPPVGDEAAPAGDDAGPAEPSAPEPPAPPPPPQ